MLTIALIAVGAYAGIALLFLAGLAAAASRPVPAVDDIVELPANLIAESESPFEKAA